MKRARLMATGRIQIEDAPRPRAGPGQVLIEVRTCGICGTDIHAFEGRHPFIAPPVVPGHEMAGVVTALGPGADGPEPGARVTIEPSLTCGRCRPCRSGRYNICEDLKVLGCQADGALSQFIAVGADRVIPLPESMPFESAALIEPAAVAVHAVRRLDMEMVSRLLIIGAGPIGLLAVQAAGALGVAEVVVSEPMEARRTLALELGASLALDGRKGLAGEFRTRFGAANPMDAVLDCAGLEVTLNQAIEAVVKGGRVVVVGIPLNPPRLRLDLVQDRELELVGTLMYTRADVIEARDMIASGRVRTEPLISAVRPMDELAEVMAGLSADPGQSIKTVIAVNRAGEREQGGGR